MAKNDRYVVMVGNKTIYSGNQRFLAWLVWLVWLAHRYNKAIACDNGIWIVEPSYWLRTGKEK